MSSLIKLKDINKYYKVGKEKFHVLKSLNINIEEGDFVMIMGKSGSGKTTLLNVLAFLDKIKSMPLQLSGGQQQRVAIARSLVNNPKLIFADEPTGALDSETSNEIMSLLKDLNNQGKTIIMVTHDADLIKYATKVVRLKDGVLYEEAYNEYN